MMILKTSNGNNSTIVEEIWKDVERYEGKYQVSSYGRLKYKDQKGEWKFRKLTKHNKRNGYLIRLCKNNVYETVVLHRLIANHFLSNPNNYPDVIHKDYDPFNNHVDNLSWGIRHCAKFYNDNVLIKDGIAIEVIYSIDGVIQETKILNSIARSADYIGVSPSTVSKYIKNNQVLKLGRKHYHLSKVQ